MISAWDTYRLLLGYQLRTLTEYRANMVLTLIATAMWHLPGAVLIWVAGTWVPHIGGWSETELLVLYGFSVFGDGFQQLLFEALWSFGNDFIRTGNLDRLLLRPGNSLVHVIGSRLDVEGTGAILLGLALIGYGGIQSAYPFTLANLGLIVYGLITSACIYLGINLITASTAFWMVDNMPVTFAFFQFHTYGRLPVQIFPRVVAVVITWAIPVAFAAYYPGALLLQHQHSLLGWIALPMAAMVVLLGCGLWWLGLGKYQGTGS